MALTSPKGTINTQTVAIDVSLTDDSGVESFKYFVDGNEIANTSTSLNLAYFQPGDHTFKVEATDTRGNTDSKTSTFTYSPTTTSLHDGMNQMYEDLGASLPTPTLILMAMSDLMINFWWLILVLIGLGTVAFKTWVKTKQGAVAFDK